MKVWIVIKFFGAIVSVIGPLPYGVEECEIRVADIRAEIHAAWSDPRKAAELRSMPAMGRPLTNESDVTANCELHPARPELSP